MTKLTDEERQQGLKEVLDAGWTMVKGRDAIYREFLFKDFNQVSKKSFHHLNLSITASWTHQAGHWQ